MSLANLKLYHKTAGPVWQGSCLINISFIYSPFQKSCPEIHHLPAASSVCTLVLCILCSFLLLDTWGGIPGIPVLGIFFFGRQVTPVAQGKAHLLSTVSIFG